MWKWFISFIVGKDLIVHFKAADVTEQKNIFSAPYLLMTCWEFIRGLTSVTQLNCNKESHKCIFNCVIHVLHTFIQQISSDRCHCDINPQPWHGNFDRYTICLDKIQWNGRLDKICTTLQFRLQLDIRTAERKLILSERRVKKERQRCFGIKGRDGEGNGVVFPLWGETDSSVSSHDHNS